MLPVDVYEHIAKCSIDAYRNMLAIPVFARRTLVNNKYFQQHFTVCCTTDDIVTYTLNGRFHRVDGPAIIYADGEPYLTKEKWYRNGTVHRKDGPAIIYFNGDSDWYLNGVPHRIGGPALMYRDGTREWRQDGLLHRTDGPAVEYPDGGGKYYIAGYRKYK